MGIGNRSTGCISQCRVSFKAVSHSSLTRSFPAAFELEEMAHPPTFQGTNRGLGLGSKVM
jgi:hypothetical protein